MPKVNLRAKPTDDKRWNGIHRHYFTFFTLKNLLLLPFIGLVVAESVLVSRWGRQRHVTSHGSVKFWSRIGLALIPDIVITLITAYGVLTREWHPIAAIVTSIGLAVVWATAGGLNIALTYSGETVYWRDSRGRRDAWDSMCYAEAGFAFAFALVYLIMLAFAAKGAHEWRKERARTYNTVEEGSA